MYSNNPFLDDPSNSSARFPDISASVQETTSQYASWIGPQPTGYVTQAYPQYQQTQYTVQTTQPTGYNPLQAQPTGVYGQQHISGSSYGYLAGQTTSQQTPAYRPAQQQILSNPGYAAQFDPYAPIGQGWEGATPANRSPPQLLSQTTSVGSFGVPTSQQTPTTSRSASGLLHPREFVRTYKSEIERWDNHTWKQLLNGFESLKDAWSARKQELATKAGQLQQQIQYADYYQAQQIQQEGSRLQGLWKEAEANFDSVAASTFQMREVYSGYRHSPDLASKRRVREATNAALRIIPDWPQQFY